MYYKNTKEIVREIAKEYGLKEEEVYEIVKSPFAFLVDIMRSADRDTVKFPSLRIPNFGLFFCTEGRKKFYERLNKNKQNGREEESIKSEST